MFAPSIKIALFAGLLMITPAIAAELSEDTLVRAVTIFPNGSPGSKQGRVVINPGVGTLAECRETIKDMSELTAADDGMIFMCIPADLNDGLMIDRGLPLQQYQAN